MSTEGCLVPSRRTIFDIFSAYCGTVITVPYDISPYYISNNEKRRTFYGASLSYYWEFLTVMNRASTRRVVSGFRKE